ncbi:hypothetical protein [Arthrobacter sp. C152]
MGENNTPDQRPPSRRANVRAAVVPLLGLAAVLAGALIAWSNREAYFTLIHAPLGNTPVKTIGGDFVTEGAQAGIAIAVAGLLLVAFWAGHRAGRRGAASEG